MIVRVIRTRCYREKAKRVKVEKKVMNSSNLREVACFVADVTVNSTIKEIYEDSLKKSKGYFPRRSC